MRVDGTISYTRIQQIGIGQGMNSTVWLADDPQLGGEVAAKEIPKTRFANPINYFDETQTMFEVAHDNVVAVQYACQTPELISLIMPYYHNRSLADRIQDRPLQLSELQRVAQGVLAGIAHIHLKGYVHFDVKPSNVLFSNTNRPMVADFGQSRAISSTGVVNTPPLYMDAQPPEAIGTGIATKVRVAYWGIILVVVWTVLVCVGNGFAQQALPPPAGQRFMRSGRVQSIAARQSLNSSIESAIPAYPDSPLGLENLFHDMVSLLQRGERTSLLPYLSWSVTLSV